MKLFSEETVMVDDCQCVYCGHVFGGRNACNADMDCHTIKCPKCEKDMNVMLSIEYTCTPMEED